MNIRFLQDYRGVLTDEKFYRKGDIADLPNGQKLVDAGRAVMTVNDYLVENHDLIFDDFDDDELKKLAKARGIRGYARMKRKTLIKRINEN